MRFFSRVTFICNVCFIIAVILRWVEMSRRTVGNFNGAIKYQPLAGTLIILGYGAVFLNLIFFLFAIYWLFAGKIKLIPAWIILFNVLILPLEVYFFFFSS